MTNGPDVTAQEYAYRSIRAAVPAEISVKTRPRTNGELPYVFIGEAELSEHPVTYEIAMTVQTWSQKENAVQCKQLQHAVRAALDGIVHTDVVESGAAATWRFTLIYEETSRTQLEPSNSVWHGTQRFRILAEPSA